MRAKGALIFLAVAHAAAVAAGFLAPYDYAEQHRDYPFAAPARVHLFGDRPAVADPNDPSRLYPVHWFTHGRLFGVDPPGVIFLLGADAYGRDILSRLLYGARISLFTGLLAASLSLALGLLFGTLSGYFGGWTDRVTMRAGELMLVLPWLYLLLAVRGWLPLHIAPAEAFVLLIAVIGSVGWVRPARLVRAAVMGVKEREFVAAARAFGARAPYMIRRHILPFTWGVVLTQATILIPQHILAEVSLSFLGLGVGEPVPSWGNMLGDGMQFHAIVSYPWMLLPGLAVVPILLGYVVLAGAMLSRAPSFELGAGV